MSENFIESVVNTTLKRQREEESIALSSLSSFAKRTRITRRFGIRDNFIDVDGVFSSLPPVGNDPGVFLWDDDRSENQHADEFTEYIRNRFLGLQYLHDNVVENVHNNRNYLDVVYIHGGCDVSVYKKTEAPVHKQGIRLVIEVKKVSYHLKMNHFMHKSTPDEIVSYHRNFKEKDMSIKR